MKELNYKDQLSHYGVLGMRWGKRRGSLISKVKTMRANKAKIREEQKIKKDKLSKKKHVESTKYEVDSYRDELKYLKKNNLKRGTKKERSEKAKNFKKLEETYDGWSKKLSEIDVDKHTTQSLQKLFSSIEKESMNKLKDVAYDPGSDELWR